MTQSVDLEPQEWQQVISALAMTNPLLVKISMQLQRQAAPDPQAMDIRGRAVGNSKEGSHP